MSIHFAQQNDRRIEFGQYPFLLLIPVVQCYGGFHHPLRRAPLENPNALVGIGGGAPSHN